MTTDITPWWPYEIRTDLVSSGRRTLTSAFADFVSCQAGFPPYDLPEIFAVPEDEGENDAARDLVRLDAEHLARMFSIGRLETFVRPLGGGAVVGLAAELWELDDPLPRFATGALNLEHWSDAQARPTHRIFVDSSQFDEWIAAIKPLGPLTSRQVQEIGDPQLRAARAVAARRVEEHGIDELDGTRRVVVPADPPGVGPLLLSIDEVSQLVRRSSSSIYQNEKDGTFPERIKLGSSTRWKKSEVLAWIEEQAAKARQELAPFAPRTVYDLGGRNCPFHDQIRPPLREFATAWHVGGAVVA